MERRNRLNQMGVACGGFVLLLWLTVTLTTAQEPPAGGEPAPPPAETATPPAAPPPEEGEGEGEAAMGSPPTDVLPSSSPNSLSAAGDIQNFQADLFTGRLTYGIPIAVAPARQGSQPRIVLGYNSSGGNGWCGVGWSLDMGYVQRETRFGVPIKWGATTPTNHYDNNMGFVASIGGVTTPLVLVDTNNNVYRAEVDNGSFLKFSFTTNSWIVTDKGSNQFFFGQSLASRMDNTKFPNNGTNTFRWAINKIVDANGNQTLFYYASTNNLLYLTNICYNLHTAGGISATNTVTFVLTNRSDASITYLPGYRVETRKLLQAIEVRAGTQQVRKYVLTYTNSPSTSRSLLQKVTVYGTDFTTAFPSAQTFTYQVQSARFLSETNWSGLYSQGETTAGWNSVRSADGNNDYRAEIMDFDGDGLPDRVMRKNASTFTNYFALQYNTGENPLHPIQRGFWPTNSNCQVAPLQSQDNSEAWNSVRAIDGSSSTHVDLVDLDGDLRPDRVMRKVDANYTNFWVQLNLGSNAFTSGFWYGPVTNENSVGNADWSSPRFGSAQNKHGDLVDMNGDGLIDRVMRKHNTPYTNYFSVQFNFGGSFGPLAQWSPVLTYAGDENSASWGAVYGQDGSANTQVGLWDINGDGLPDRVLRKQNSPYTTFSVQFNNGAGFEALEDWGTLDTQGEAGSGWGSPVATSSGNTFATLADINGDGLLDRVMRTNVSPFNKFVVQINNGAGFNSPGIAWTNVSSQGQTDSEWNSIVKTGSGDTTVDFLDMNGDGLPDRVMRKFSAEYTNFVVQLNAGPFPDLLSTIQNGIGGKVQVSYQVSTRFDNRDRSWAGNPWTAGALSLLPFPVHTVSTITNTDGRAYATSTNVMKYAFANGMFDPGKREFRGFHKATVVDVFGGTNVSYFHQGGGRDESNGKYQDTTHRSKKGIPYRVEVYGTNGALYSLSLNKVDEVMLYTNTTTGQTWCFPFVSQIIQREHEGLGTNTYKAVCRQFQYHAATTNTASTGNLTNEINLGWVTNVIESSHVFNDAGSDSLYTMMQYNNLAKVTNILISTDSSATVTNRHTRFTYDTKGNKLSNSAKLTGSTFLTDTLAYDSYGNLTNTTDRVGITTAITYDSSLKTFPIVKVVGGSFVNTNHFDSRSGAVTNAVDVKNLQADTIYDIFFRPLTNRVATTTNIAPTLVREIFEYGVGGMGTTGLSTNYVRRQVNNPIGTADGYHDSWTYADGFGRSIQSRVESEIATNHYRTVDTFFNEKGQPEFTTIPYLSTNAANTLGIDTKIGTLTDYDSIGRAARTMVVNAPTENGSPVGTNTVAYADGTNPWATVTTDAEGKVRKSYHDSYARTTNLIEVVGGSNYSTVFKYDRIGNLTNTTDNASNVTSMQYDLIDRKTNMVDPDMGTWSYQYDAASRLTNQADAKGQKIALFYEANNLGRLTNKIVNAGAAGAITNTFTYDSNGGVGGYTVFKGQLFEVKDRQGWQRNSYDARGRVLKTDRFLNIKSTTYTVTSTYDDADRATNFVYPGSVAALKYTYDSGANLKKVEATSGTGASRNEVFYTLQGMNAAGQVTNIIYGNGITNVFSWYTNTLRSSRIQAKKLDGTYHQDLSYTYDKVSNLKTLTNHVAGYTGDASSTLTSVQYDDLHRLTNYVHNATTYKFAYNSIGNVLTNGELGAGGYFYGAKPHAVTNANGKTYQYDACGNMTNRFGATLTYDEENQLKQYQHGAGTNVFYGYAEGGQRLWSSNAVTGKVTIWIGGVYEEKHGTNLCHVIAGSRRVCTFEPSQNACAWLPGREWLFACLTGFETGLTWPFDKGRARYTLMLIPLLGVLCVSVIARWRERLACGCYWLRIWWKGRTRAKTQRRKVFWSWRLGDLARGFFDALIRDIREIRGSPSGSWFSVQSSAFDVQRSRLYFPRSPILRFSHSVISVLLIVGLFLGTTTEVRAVPTCAPVFYYYHGDHLGSSNIMTDRCGLLVDHYEYTAFGKERFNDTTCSFPVSHRYTGQILDSETGLYYYNARYYDPELGRFTQADTLVPGAGNSQNFNRYSYVNNNPLMYTDPTGHENFFSGLGKAITNSFSNPGAYSLALVAGWFTVPIFGMTLLGAAVAFTAPTAISYSTGQAFGPQAQSYVDAAFGVASAVGSLIVGIVLTATGNPVGGAFMITSAVLSLASTGASLAGDNQLAEALGWAALGVGVAGMVYGLLQSQNQSPAAKGESSEKSSDAKLGEPTEITDEFTQKVKRDFAHRYKTDFSKVKVYEVENLQAVEGASGEALNARTVWIDKEFYMKAPASQYLDTLTHEFGHILQFQKVPFFNIRYWWQSTVLGRGHTGHNVWEAQADFYGAEYRSAVLGKLVSPRPYYSTHWVFRLDSASRAVLVR